jgi:hypothetical protein
MNLEVHCCNHKSHSAPDQSSYPVPADFFKINLSIIVTFTPVSFTGSLFLLSAHQNAVCTSSFPPYLPHASYPIRLLSDFITRIPFGEEYGSWSLRTVFVLNGQESVVDVRSVWRPALVAMRNVLSIQVAAKDDESVINTLPSLCSKICIF